MAIQTHAEAYEIACRLLDNIETVVHGKREQIKLVVAALMCGGHVLLEDVPGTAKTVLARAIAQSIEGAHASRIQCTPDLQPTDVTGLSIFNQKRARLRVPARARSSRTSCSSTRSTARCRRRSRRCSRRWRSSRSRSTATTRRLPDPFLVIATQNPIEYEGTFPLPEAQLDRFFAAARRSAIPTRRTRRGSSRSSSAATRSTRLEPVIDARRRRRRCARAVGDVFVARGGRALDRRPRPRDPRSSTSSRSAAPSAARSRSTAPHAPGPSCNGRRYVTPEDVEQLFVPVLVHRHPLPPELPRRDPRPRLGKPRARGAGAAASSVAPKPGFDIDLDVPAAASGVDGGGRLPARPAAARDRARVRRRAQRPPRRRLRRREHARVPPGRRRRAGSTGPPRRVSRPRAAATSSSCASASPTRRRASSSSPTAGPRWRSEPSPLRRLDKPQAMLAALELIGASALAGAQPHRLPRLRRGRAVLAPPRTRARAPSPGTFERPLPTRRPTPSRAGSSFLGEHRRDLPTQAFVFVLSDFLVPPDLPRLAARARAPLGARAGRDPGSGLGAELPGRRRDHRPVRRPATGRVVPVYVTEREADAPPRRARGALGRARRATSARSASSPVVVHTHDHGDMLASFLRWADLRQMWRGSGRVKRAVVLVAALRRSRRRRRRRAAPPIFANGSSVGEGCR